MPDSRIMSRTSALWHSVVCVSSVRAPTSVNVGAFVKRGGGASGYDAPMTDFRLELVNLPVSDVDRAKSFYADRVGLTLDHDHEVTDDLRFVQLTPPGSACSIAIGTGLAEAAPGSVAGLQLVVDDIEVARAELVSRNVDASEVQVFPWGSFVFFSDPDGNAWSVQQPPDRT